MLLSQQSKATAFRSQKARGIWHLTRHAKATHTRNIAQILVIHSREEITDDLFTRAFGVGTHGIEYFARPCPLNPRHGFVDSSIVRCKEDLLKICDEIEAAGEEIEIILAPVFPAHWSAVVTPTSISIGPGNDGATSKASIMIPTFLANPHLYVGIAGEPAPRQRGKQVLKRRHLRLDKPLTPSEAQRVGEELLAMMGVYAVDAAGDELSITYDLLQATAEQMESTLLQSGTRLGRGWGEQLRRAFIHYLEENEVENLEVRPGFHGYGGYHL